jgi:hypothetical protein
MRNKILTLLVLLTGFFSQAQTDSLKIENPTFKSMIVGDDKLYALDNNGFLSVWDLKNLEKIYKSIDTVKHFSSISKDKQNQIFIGTEDGKILKLNKSNFSTELFIKLKRDYFVSDIFFNSENEIFLIVPYAIYDPIRNEKWTDFVHSPNGIIVRKRFLFFFRKKTNTYFDMPQYTFIDSKDRIWMIKSWGEFGGTVQIFDTRKKRELKANIDNLDFGLLSPKSVFEDDKKNIYVTSGLQHFMNSGEIYKISDNKASLIYSSENFRDTTDNNPFDSGVFVGPGQYNENEHKIYFATTSGFYRSEIPKEGRIKNPEFLFKPDLIWEQEPLAIGIGMTIKKLEFTKDNKLVFLTSNNGIGIYDGKKLIMLE